MGGIVQRRLLLDRIGLELRVEELLSVAYSSYWMVKVVAGL